MLRAGLHMVFCLGFHALSIPSLSDMSQDQNAEPILQCFRGDCFLLKKTTWGEPFRTRVMGFRGAVGSVLIYQATVAREGFPQCACRGLELRSCRIAGQPTID